MNSYFYPNTVAPDWGCTTGCRTLVEGGGYYFYQLKPDKFEKPSEALEYYSRILSDAGYQRVSAGLPDRSAAGTKYYTSRDVVLLGIANGFVCIKPYASYGDNSGITDLIALLQEIKNLRP